MTNISAEGLANKLKENLQASHVEMEDVSSGCGAKFNAVIVSDNFNGKPLLQRHRMVNDCLSEELKIIHAFSMKTLTPEQWTKQQNK
ncbi:bolA-like protein 2 [Patiria miniata]|uniref:BolA-like protein 2 n=1 Tax=Patiria miniata TaxID=46514 RepID=A0A913ZRQ6_PATMI|nr:bolA-like protein 2 [Patiria miniata]XP_038053840.1 bolA-like protein 2 [Patiria miniata]